MATHIFGPTGALHIGSYSTMSGFVRAFSMSVEADAIDETPMGATTRKMRGGLRKAAWSAELMVDHATLMEEYINSFVTQQIHAQVTYMPDPASSSLAIWMNSRIAKRSAPHQIGELLVMTVDGEAYEGDFPSNVQVPVRGTYLGVFSGTTTPQVSTGVQLGALASASDAVVLGVHYNGYTGPGSLTLSVESDDNSGFTSATTRATATAVTSIDNQPRLAPIVGPITDDWWRVRAVKSSGALCSGLWFLGKVSLTV